MLLAVALPLLLLGLALLNQMAEPQAPASSLEPTAQEAAGTLELALEEHSDRVASLAAEPVIATATGYATAAVRRLEAVRAETPGLEALAILDQSGDPVAEAGQSYTLSWQDIPAFRASLQGQRGISPVAADSPQGGQIDRLVFTAPVQHQPGQAARVVVAVIGSDALLDSVDQVLRGSQTPGVSSGDFVQQVKRRMQVPTGDSALRLAALTTRPQADGFPGQEGNAGVTRIYREVTPGGASAPWYLLLEAETTPEGGMPLAGNLSLAMALGAVMLAITAGQIIIRPSRPALARHAAVSPVATPQEVFQRLVAVQEAVRQEMADYLHGHVQSKLVALSMALGICQQMLDRDPARACQMLEHIQDELQKVQDEDVRRVSRELFPSIIKMGLAPAMRSLVGRFNNFVEVDLTIDPKIVAMDQSGATGFLEKRRLGVYRVAEEALNNALKHANASRLQVGLVCQGESLLVLSVADDGDGFKPDSVADSHGLMGMRDYAEAIGGRTEITSAPGQGTTVRLTLPLPVEEAAAA